MLPLPGIDMRSGSNLSVGSPPDRDEESYAGVRSWFFTVICIALGRIASSRCGFRTVAMESPGVYWIPLFLKPGTKVWKST